MVSTQMESSDQAPARWFIPFSRGKTFGFRCFDTEGKLRCISGFTSPAERDSAAVAQVKQFVSPLIQPSLFAASDQSSASPMQPLEENFRLEVLSGGPGVDHTKESFSHVRRLNLLAGFSSPNQISVSRLRIVLGAIVRHVPLEDAKLLNTDAPGMKRFLRKVQSYRTRNKHLGTYKRFCEWLVGQSLLSHAVSTAIGLIKPLNIKLDRRHQRGALRDDFLVKLINAAIDGPKWKSFTGPDRAAFYLFQAASGLREGATRRIQVWQLSLRSIQPTVTELAWQEKGRKERVVPLRADDAAWLRGYLEPKLATAQAFNIPPKTDCAEMMRFDLTRAGISFGEETTDEKGVKRRRDWIDIHSLKASYATRLHLLAGANMKVLEDLVGHYSAEFTIENYVKTIPQDALDALHRLPPLAVKPLPRTG